MVSFNCIRVTGNGKNALFWEDNWVGGSSLKYLFPHLYKIELKVKCVISDRVGWEGNNLCVILEVEENYFFNGKTILFLN